MAALGAALLLLRPGGDEPPRRSVAFERDPAPLLRPESGFFHQDTDQRDGVPRNPRADGVTVIRQIVRLDDFRAVDALPPDFLAGLERDVLGHARRTGVKLIVRFAYNFGPEECPGCPEPARNDAPLPRVLGHIGQLAPLVNENRDVVAWVEAGFIGQWGEWHNSDNALIGGADGCAPAAHVPNDATRQITDRLLGSLDPSVFVALRFLRTMELLRGGPVTAAEAFSGSDIARLGFFTDFAFNDTADGGLFTYTCRDDYAAYAARQSLHTPVGGESDPRRTVGDDDPAGCRRAEPELRRLHWTAMHGPAFEGSGQPDVIELWRREGCFERIGASLGFRPRLVRASSGAGAVAAGRSVGLDLEIQSDGYGASLSPRRLVVGLRRAEGGPAVRIPVEGTDPRFWSGMERVGAAVAVPRGTAPGRYELLLALPDASERLAGDPRYAVPFASRLDGEPVFEPATGWNRLGLELDVR